MNKFNEWIEITHGSFIISLKSAAPCAISNCPLPSPSKNYPVPHTEHLNSNPKNLQTNFWKILAIFLNNFWKTLEKLSKTQNKLRLYKSIVGTRKNIYFKILPIQYSKDQNQKINKEIKTLRNLIVKKN